MTAGTQDAIEAAQLALAEAMAKTPFRRYAAEFLWLEDEKGRIIPFVLNEAQIIVDDEVERQIAIGKPVRVLILKGRQQGMSSYCQGRKAHRAFTRRTRGLTVGHVLGAVHELWGKLDRAYKGLANSEGAKELLKGGINLQPPLDPGMGEKGRRTVFADPLGSVCRYDSASDPQAVGRGITCQFIHATEVPQWAKPAETMQAILAIIPDDPDTMVFVETTAKGASGWFFEKWCEAMDDVKRGIEPEFYPVFVPWWVTERYKRKRRSGEPKLSKDELEFKAKYSLTDEQCYWYRDQRRKYGEQVTEEFPSTWQEAFLSSGLPYFRREVMETYRQSAKDEEDVLRTGRYKMIGEKVAVWTEEPGGNTRIYGMPEHGHRYSIGVDFASGRAKDYSAIVVIDVDANRVVATHRSKWLPDAVLDEAVLLGLTYHHCKAEEGRCRGDCGGKPALIVPERNGIGQTLVDRLVHKIKYGNVYREHDTVAVKHHRGVRYGWATSNRSRQWLLEELARSVHQRSLAIPCPFVVGEMSTFVYTDEDGEHAAASDDANDDLVMALAFAHRGMSYMPAASRQTEAHLSPAERRANISSKCGY